MTLRVSYDVTPMAKGGYRAECLVEYRGRMCGWWKDSRNRRIAVDLLRHHMRTAHDTRSPVEFTFTFPA